MILDGPDAVHAALGTHFGYSDWLEISQARIDAFAAATGSPAAELLVLSLSNLFLPQIVEVRGFTAGLNYGTGEVRFPAPVSPGARVRGGASLTAVTDIAGGLQTVMSITVELDGSPEPACTVESISRWIT